MPSFPHTLIGLGPFADLGCNIVFTKTSVIVYHPDGHPILSGWWDETGLRLWHFPPTVEAAQDASDDASPQPLISSPPPRATPAAMVNKPRKQKRVSVFARNQKRVSLSTPHPTLPVAPPQVPPASVVLPWPSPAPVITSLSGHPHPSQGILATSTSRAVCLVYFIYGATQAVALAARAAGTPFDPRSLDLLSIGALVLDFIMPVLAFQSNRPGLMPSKQETVTRSKA